MMGKLGMFAIILDRSKSVYYPSEQVTGKCVIGLNADMKMKSIHIVMGGMANVHWTETRSSGSGSTRRTETIHYRAENEFFLITQALFGPGTGGDQVVLTQGHHEFRFTFQLPPGDIPTSFEGEYGSIRYWLKAEIVKAWAFNSTTKRAFTIISTIDINRREYLVPVENNVQKVLCCLCCTSGPISLYARTDRKGYCPGESIAITAEFENLSRRTVVPQAVLYQKQTFFAGGKSRTCDNKYATVTGLAIPPGQTASWDAQLLQIPAISPSIINCLIIRVDYTVRITLQIPGAINLHADLPVIIGTVPFYYGRSHAMPYNVNMDTMSNMTGQLQMPNYPTAPSYSEFDQSIPVDAPPAYAESVEGAVDIADDGDKDVVGDTKFTPMYAYVQNYQYQPPTAFS